MFVCNIKYRLIDMCCTLFGREQTCCTEQLASVVGVANDVIMEV